MRSSFLRRDQIALRRPSVLDLSLECVLWDWPCTFTLARRLSRAGAGSEKVVVHGDGVSTVGRSSGKHVKSHGAFLCA
jgi:hypothetical protein